MIDSVNERELKEICSFQVLSFDFFTYNISNERCKKSFIAAHLFTVLDHLVLKLTIYITLCTFYFHNHLQVTIQLLLVNFKKPTIQLLN